MCGLVGIIGKEPVSEWIYKGLIHLQHRGQDAAGIYSFDPESGKGKLHKSRGLVNQVFTPETLPFPGAGWSLGHVRYSTVGAGRPEDTQPLVSKKEPQVVLAHNGNIVNYLPLKRELEERGALFETTCDAEVLLNRLALHLSEGFSFQKLKEAVKEIFSHTDGAYSVIGFVNGSGMFAFRDPWGFRPLLQSRSPDGEQHAFASETGPLTFLGFENIHDVEPGELVFVDREGRVQRALLAEIQHSHCSFEFNYFAKPNAVMEKREIYRTRARLGSILAQKVKEAKIEADVVVPIPDSARPSGIALAHELGIPLEEGFVKHHHIGRTFIMPTQYARKKALSEKLITVQSVFQGRRVVLVDDSIVRGTVSCRVIELARRAGAKEIVFASTYPPIRYPCSYGIDFPREEQLIAFGKSLDEIAESIGADKVVYNDISGLKEAIGIHDLCTACLTGDYPTAMHGLEELQNLREQDLSELEAACRN